MSIAPSDILFKLSTKLGTAGNQNTQINQNASLGGYISTTLYAGGTLHDLFAPISGLDNLASANTHRCIFIHNTHGTLTYQSIRLWMTGLTVGGANIALGVDPTIASGISTSPLQAVQVSTEYVAPVGVTFTSPAAEGSGISIGDLLPGQCRAVWIKRTAANTAAVTNDSVILHFGGDSL